ncbi:hypothetical protein HBA53_18695 [Rhodococcus pyridinivorans]|nr:hypothetical protein HBA53_18695 [Rhodococcus pyridinivorans]
MTFERGADESIHAVSVDRLLDEGALRWCQGVEPCRQAGPAARRGQSVDGKWLLLTSCIAGEICRVGKCSRFISWFKNGSGDRGVTPLGRSCHPAALRLVTSFRAAG